MNSETSLSAQSGEYFVHPQAICETTTVGAGTRIWAFSHVLPKAKIGRDCNICDGVFIENDVVLGDRVTIKCGVQLWDGLTLEDNAFVGPNATFTNTLFPRSKEFQEVFLRTVVCRNASIGANATILPGISIGQNAMVGAGSVVTQSVPPNAIVFGNPARIVGYVDSQPDAIKTPAPVVTQKVEPVVQETGVKGVTLHRLSHAEDASGHQTSGDFARDIPFLPRQYFLVSGVPGEKTRGQHAHRKCHLFLVCVQGSCAVLVDDGLSRREIDLSDPLRGLYLPAMTWGTQFRFTGDALLLVFASAPSNLDDRIQDYGLFLREVGQ